MAIRVFCVEFYFLNRNVKELKQKRQKQNVFQDFCAILFFRVCSSLPLSFRFHFFFLLYKLKTHMFYTKLKFFHFLHIIENV